MAKWVVRILLVASFGAAFLAPRAALRETRQLRRQGLPAAFESHATEVAGLVDRSATTMLLADGEVNYVSYLVGVLFASALAFYAVIIFATPKKSKWD